MRYKLLIPILILLIGVISGCQQAPPAPSEPSAATVAESSADPSGEPAQSETAEGPYKKIVKTSGAYSYEQMVKDIKALEKQYPELIQTGLIGQSVEGRELPLIKLGTGGKNIFLCGAHHAREYITSTYLMKMADEYAYAYANGGDFDGRDIKSLVDDFTVYIVPMVNPDGVNLVQNGPEAAKDPDEVKKIKMLKSSYSEWKANIRGVDLNRQYPVSWDVKASNTDVPSSEMYKGSAPASEPEVQAVMKLCNEVSFELAVSFHSKGEIIYWADSGTVDAIPAARGLAETLSQTTGYEVMPVSEDPAVYGAGFENWFRAEFSRPGFCIELTPSSGDSLPSDDKQFEKLVWSKTKDLGIQLMEEAKKLKN